MINLPKNIKAYSTLLPFRSSSCCLICDYCTGVRLLYVKKKHVHRHRGGNVSHPTFPNINMWPLHGLNRNRPPCPPPSAVIIYVHNVCPRIRQRQGSCGYLIGMCFNRSPYCPTSFSGWGKKKKKTACTVKKIIDASGYQIK